MIQSYNMHDYERLLRQQALSTYEQMVFKGNVAETWRDPSTYAAWLGYGSVDNFKREIAGKDICDIGSGIGGLEKGLTLDGFDTSRIVSVNPVVHTRRFIKQEKSDTNKILKELPRTIIRKLRRDFFQNTVDAFAHNLPFANESFDIVFDMFAASHYTNTSKTPLVFEASILEMLRILRPGGELRIGDPLSYGKYNADGSPVSENEKILLSLGLAYEIIYDNEDKETPRRGVIIYKI